MSAFVRIVHNAVGQWGQGQVVAKSLMPRPIKELLSIGAVEEVEDIPFMAVHGADTINQIVAAEEPGEGLVATPYPADDEADEKK